MPILDGEKFKYDKKGKAAYAKALMKKLKKKRISEDGDQQGDQSGY